MTRLAIVIPTTERGLSQHNVTMRTLQYQSWRDFSIAVMYDVENKGAPWARNIGFRSFAKDYELVLFCDDDICWAPNALEKMIKCLDQHQGASYVYCAYQMAEKIISTHAFSADLLKRMNYISTMSVIRTVDFPSEGFDEALKRFQDWDMWLTMLRVGKVGVYCGEVLFKTNVRPGLTHGNPVTPQMATDIVKRKHEAWIMHAIS